MWIFCANIYALSSSNLFSNQSVIYSAVASSFFIATIYPLTQIYQHSQDKADGVRTISAVLGYRGTFIFCSIVLFLSSMALAFYFGLNLELNLFMISQAIMFPVLIYFLWWMNRVWKDTTLANYRNTMRMNVVASICSNIAFITILIINQSWQEYNL